MPELLNVSRVPQPLSAGGMVPPRKTGHVAKLTRHERMLIDAGHLRIVTPATLPVPDDLPSTHEGLKALAKDLALDLPGNASKADIAAAIRAHRATTTNGENS